MEGYVRFNHLDGAVEVFRPPALQDPSGSMAPPPPPYPPPWVSGGPGSTMAALGGFLSMVILAVLGGFLSMVILAVLGAFLENPGVYWEAF